MTADSRRILGYGFIAGAAGMTILMLAWLATSGAQGGGIILGLLLLLVLAGPLGAVGAYLLFSGTADLTAERAFSGKQRILDADRLFRHELAARLTELADALGAAGARLRILAQRAERSVGDEAAWYSAVQLTDPQIELLKQYDDLVWERVRSLRAHTDAPPPSIAEAIDQLERAMDERTDLLVRGRQAPSVAPAALLRASRPAVRPGAVQEITPGDALTRDGVDYVVEAVATSFADGQSRKLAHLVPSGPEDQDHWLDISPGALEVGWLDRVATPVTPGAPQLGSLPLATSGSATVTVSTRGGVQPSVLVTYWVYRGATALGLVQQWPDGALQAYIGTLIRPHDLQVWPALSNAEVAHIS